MVEPAPGDPGQIGVYTVLGRLGEGGQGVVYLGRSPSGELRAIKVLQAESLADPAARQRLAREVAAAGQVAAFCTALVIEASLDGSMPYIVTEFIEGPTLAEHLSRHGPMTGSDLDRLAIGTATALVAIHGAGVVHRDFKPSNVILGSQGPRVIDFGIAKVVSVAPVTLTHQMLGTPTFMAPEQALGQLVGPAADLFAWACTIAYAATLHAPFSGPSLAAIVHRVTHAEPDLAGVGQPLAQILLHCLAKDPAHRPTAQQALLLLLGQPLPPGDLHDPTELLTQAAATTIATTAVAWPTVPAAALRTPAVSGHAILAPEQSAPTVPAPTVPAPTGPAVEYAYAQTLAATAAYPTRLDSFVSPVDTVRSAPRLIPAPRGASPDAPAPWNAPPRGPLRPSLLPRRRNGAVAAFTVVAVMVAGAAGGWLSIRTMQVLRSAHSYSADKAAFDLPALAGSSHVRLAEHRGRPVVVDFFATWCVYCTLELPGLVQVAKAGAGQVDFIAVQTEDTGDGVAMARRFGLAEAGITLAHDIGPAPASQLWSAFGATGIPVTAFYDAQGKLVDFSAGMSGEAELLQRIKRVFGLDLHAADASSLQAPVSPLTPQGAAELLGSTGVNKAYTVLDVSTPAQFAAGHLRGAVRLDATAPNPAARLSARSRETSYIVYGRDAARAVALADRMHQMGFKHVYEIEGGFAAWTTAGLPAAW